jgi:hypothetical protein
MIDLVERYLIDESKLSQADIELLKSRGKVPKDFKGFTTQRDFEIKGKSPGKSTAKKRQAHGKAADMDAPAKVGDIFYNSWGYDQTNIDWYQVVALTKSGKSVKIRPIAGKVKESGFMSGTTTPMKGKFTGPAVTKRLMLHNGEPYLPSQYGWTSLWDGKPKHISWYA